jgi:cytochrome P450
VRYQPVRYPPGEALLALYRRRGAVINSGVGRHGYTYLLGPEANKFVFAKADAFSWRETFQNLALVDGPTALIVSDGDDHRRRRSVVAPGLRHRQIQDYVQTMVACIDTVIDGWRPGQQLDIYRQCRSAVRRSTAESLFGQRIAVLSDFLGEQLQPLLDLTHRLQLVGAAAACPGTGLATGDGRPQTHPRPRRRPDRRRPRSAPARRPPVGHADQRSRRRGLCVERQRDS